MRRITILAAALVTLAGCNMVGGGNTSNGTNASAANTAGTANQAAQPTASAAPAPSNSGPVQLDRAFMVGRWTDDNDCSNVTEFTEGGRFIAATGGGGSWSFEGDRLTMSGNGSESFRITAVDQNTVTLIDAAGNPGRVTRC